MSKEKNYTGYCNGVNRFSFDFLECKTNFFDKCCIILGCAEYMTKKILEEVKFYDRFNPYDLFKSGVFGSGCGIENEHLININLDITDKSLTYKDSFQWDIINEENM